MPSRAFTAAAGYRLSLVVVAVVTVAISLIGGTPTPAVTVPQTWFDTSDREVVLLAWQAERLRQSEEMEWTGAHDGCDPGSSSEALAQLTVDRVNFYRAMAGVPADVTLDLDYSAKAQHGALAMSATGRLSHDPDDSFVCLDDTAREAAANSNLYLGRTGPSAIDGYIEDPGDRNKDVGHRNTILHPPTKRVGVGHVAGTSDNHPSNVLWVFDEHVFDPNPAIREPQGFVAWPPRGYVPAELVHPRWSFGLAEANFDQAEVSMTISGQPVPLEVVTRHSLPDYVPLPILVWEPSEGALPQPEGDADVVVSVVVEGVEVDGEIVDVSYQVILIDGDDGPGSGNAALRLIEQSLRRTGAQTPLPMG